MTDKPRAKVSMETVKDFWSAHINNEYYTRAERGSPAYFDEIERRRYRWHYHLRELFDTLAGGSGRLLEVGCGIGMDSVQLARCGFDVAAVDLSAEAVEVARRFAERRGVQIDFRVGNAEGLDFPDATFDVVYSFGVLHHTPDIESAVREVHRVLTPGGTAHVMLYHKHSLVNLVHRIFRLPYESRSGRDSPVNYTFARRSVRRLFGDFHRVSVRTEYPFTFGFGLLGSRTPVWLLRILGRLFGWHLMITAVKG